MLIQKLSIIIPAYNEEKTLEELVQKVLNVKFPTSVKKEIIVLDDCSKDATWRIIEKLSSQYPDTIKGLQNVKNLGKSQTVRKGILNSTGEYVVIQDADLEYEPNELVDLLSLVLKQNVDVVYGNRFGKKNKVIYLQNYIGNKGLTVISNLFTFPRFKIWIPDMEVCYKMIRGDVARIIAEGLVARSNFGFEPEITAKLSRYKVDGKHLKLGIIPISYYPRSVAEGKKMKAFQDGIKALREILVYNLSSKS